MQGEKLDPLGREFFSELTSVFPCIMMMSGKNFPRNIYEINLLMVQRASEVQLINKRSNRNKDCNRCYLVFETEIVHIVHAWLIIMTHSPNLTRKESVFKNPVDSWGFAHVIFTNEAEVACWRVQSLNTSSHATLGSHGDISSVIQALHHQTPYRVSTQKATNNWYIKKKSKQTESWLIYIKPSPRYGSTTLPIWVN